MADTWMPPSKTLYSGQFISSTQVIKPNYHVFEKDLACYSKTLQSLCQLFCSRNGKNKLWNIAFSRHSVSKTEHRCEFISN